jgi:hypothetical protein
MSGYSGTPLATKLGIQPGHTIALLGAPRGFAIEALPPDVVIRRRLGTTPLDVIVMFVDRRAKLAAGLAPSRRVMKPAAGLWIAWPKKTSGVATDMTEHVVRELALPTGLVDNKVCAIDDVWSGLRLVIRRELR